MSDVVIYTKPDCPHCAKAKAWYGQQGIAFTEKNAQDNRAYRAEMFVFSNNDPTVPSHCRRRQVETNRLGRPWLNSSRLGQPGVGHYKSKQKRAQKVQVKACEFALF